MISLASSLSMFQATFVRICQHLVFCLFVFVYCGCCCLHGSKGLAYCLYLKGLGPSTHNKILQSKYFVPDC